MAWLVYRLTSSAALLGLTTFVALVPQLVVSPLAGAWIDRYDKRRLLVMVECLLALQATALAVLTASESITPALLVWLAALLGILNAIETPLRQSLISRLVDDRAALPNALALSASLFTASRLLGPPLAGLLLGLVGEATCFALNALSYLMLVLPLAWMRLAPAAPTAGSLGKLLIEGIYYVRQTPLVRQLIVSVMAVNITASSYVVLLPIYARDIFAGDARTLGWLWGAAGLGSLAAAMLLAGHASVPRLPRLILAALLLSGAGMGLLGAVDTQPTALLAMVMMGFGITVANVGTNILIQSSAPERLRGRVISLYTATRFGFDALGGLIAGLAASHLGAPPVAVLGAALLFAYCAWAGPRLYRVTSGATPDADRAST